MSSSFARCVRGATSTRRQVVADLGATTVRASDRLQVLQGVVCFFHGDNVGNLSCPNGKGVLVCSEGESKHELNK